MANARIVVGADGSPGSLAAVRWAAAEALLRDAELRVVVAHHGPATPGVLHEAVTAAREAAPGVDARGVELSGYAAPALLRAAESATLLVVGDRTGGELPGRPSGSVAAQVATQARCSVVVVRGRPPAGGPVVVGVDDDPAADRVIGRAFEEAALRGTSLVAVTAGQQAGADGLEAWRERFKSVPAQREYVPGRPDKVLVDCCRAAQLAVVGPRRHGFEGVLLGAVGTSLLRRAGCPVLIAR